MAAGCEVTKAPTMLIWREELRSHSVPVRCRTQQPRCQWTLQPCWTQ